MTNRHNKGNLLLFSQQITKKITNMSILEKVVGNGLKPILRKKILVSGQNEPQGLSLKIQNYGGESKSPRSFWPGYPKHFFGQNSFSWHPVHIFKF